MLNQNQSVTGGLTGVLDIKLNAKFMLTVNLHLQDRLVKGQQGTVKCIHTDSVKCLKILYKV